MRKNFIVIAASALLISLEASPVQAQRTATAIDAGTFEQMAASSDAFETESSRLALERAGSSAVRSYAQRMIEDHSMTTAALQGTTRGGTVLGSTILGTGIGALAGGPVGAVVGAGVGATTGAAASGAYAAGGVIADPRHMAMLRELSALQGRSSDRAYKRMQIAAHQEAVALFSTYASNPDDPELAAFARQTLSHLRSHLTRARQL
jgi:predicted outer membrane protein